MGLGAWILYCIFISISLYMLFQGLRNPSGVFQYPFLAGSVWLFYIGFQALGVMLNPSLLPPGAVLDNGVEKALVMASLCAGFGFWGYSSGRSVAKNIKSKSFSYYHLWFGGVLLILIGWSSFLKLASLSGGIFEHYSIEGSYELTWRGLPVAYVFFVKLIYPGLAICLFEALRRHSPIKWAVVASASFIPLANVLFLGRRGEAVTLVLVLALTWFFQRGWTPSRSTVIVVVIAGALMVIVAPVYREYSLLGSQHQKILEIDVKKMILAQVAGKERSEFHYPVVQLAATDRAMEFNYGVGFINRLIQEWVPAILVGRNFKNSLFFDAVNFNKHTLRYYNWLPNYGWIPTAIVDVFREFWYFGSALFFLVGRFARYLWVRTETNTHVSKIIYISIAPLFMTSIIDGLALTSSQLVYFVVFLTPVIVFARMRGPR